ncbi:unnamed protein product [Rotaria sordida]|uniref:Uncharacterized protein n=1 Tax=Rotaria sordida TaxID=392033 RepID=A0A820AQI0_9BILA|nr:unnamed protein product [Rotaria sordida]CAF4193260.1 unnamed protein product [Rotaria sordida]
MMYFLLVLNEIKNLEPVNMIQDSCNGPHCARCGKCRDWYYTGDPASLGWLQNWKNWSKSDWERYRDNNVSTRFRQRDGARCRFALAIIDGSDILASVHLHFLGADYGLHIHTDLCLCNDNVRH